MNAAVEMLQSMLNKEYETEDGDSFSIELFKGMSEEEIVELREVLPDNYLPAEIEELLRFAKGFSFYGFEEIRFDDFSYIGYNEIFPTSVTLASDGAGNFWVIDVDAKGNWNSVYFICHDPAVVIKQANNLTEFIQQIDELGMNREESVIDVIHSDTIFKVWDGEGVEVKNTKPLDFYIDVNLPKSFYIADLRNAPVKSGFVWGKDGPDTKIIKVANLPVWIIEEKNVISSFINFFKL